MYGKLNCSIDLETFSTRSNACIISIGAVIHSSTEILKEFKVNISPKSCKDIGLHIDPETINWWQTQSKEARRGWMTDPVDIKSALSMFNDWYGEKSLHTWGNGATFDISIMENAFIAAGIACPWKYYDSACIRTISTILNTKIPRLEGTCHDSLDDARNQAKYLMEFISSFG